MLKYHDKYGKDAKRDEGERKWGIDQVTSGPAVRACTLYILADKVLAQ